MNDETILALGGFCKELLSSEAFQALVQMHSQQCAVDILATAAHETKKRDYIHASYQGFENFLALAKDFAAGFDKLQADLGSPTTTATTSDAPDIDDDPSVHDIYDGMN